MAHSMRGSRKFFFIVNEEREDPKYHYTEWTIIVPPAKRHLNEEREDPNTTITAIQLKTPMMVRH